MAVEKAMLDNDRANAWQVAHYERSQRDEYTSKLRFGLATLNAASLVTVLNVGGLLSTVPLLATLTSALAFLIGTVLAGGSLIAQQNHLTQLAGDTSVRAILLDRAVALSDSANDDFNATMDELQVVTPRTFAHSSDGIYRQHWSQGAWLTGALIIVAAQALALSSAPKG